MPVVSLVAGVLFAASGTAAQGTDLRAGRRLQLADLIRQQAGAAADLDAQARRLREEVSLATAAQARRNAPVAAARARADALAGPAALLPVSGPGVEVRLDDAPRSSGDLATGAGGPAPDDLVVHQADVQSVVNALWAGGAEAMTIMGERVVSTSAVRCVGNTLLLHGAVYSPPFVVTALGDPARLRDALDAAPGVLLFRQYVAAYGLGYAAVDRLRLRLPAYDGPLELSSVELGSAR